MNTIALAENGYLPTWLVRYGIRSLVKKRLEDETVNFLDKKESLISQLKSSPLAVDTDAANEQHYEVPADFYKIALGARLKYSCCYWPEGVNTLDEAEIASLRQICERAQLENGQRILELGCGWGSFSLWAAENYPDSQIVSVSNSSGQRRYIVGEAKKRGLSNLRVITADMNAFETEERFDRVVSVEMFEHMRNYQQLFTRIHLWLNPKAKMFIHVFSHKKIAYLFEDKDSDDWMARHFFTGGIMPSHDLLPRVCAPFKLAEQWQLNGMHYQKTAEAWFQNLDRDKARTREAMEKIYGKEEARVWENRWRIFMLSCAELFGYRRGEEWGVSHYLFETE
ncbi:cyclopropane-fatty-acyl-phospholipid synthase family protein [Pelagicoccus sp. SDUM812002]|uniref:SAM-dependent methyltransferase n=1 Tax=Pelagicoccus sp. SDUM812002 TaxID=3041266 RepID=UPI00280F560A|nr:cyclopropane-fatty-acyl-phospholipid synthase family protein [Pelagicoccus sp. SDUM812002]MDQ8185049.1 cyclopropane-fatty-acyl-phospholipid synthase [Pelagicoccus sp. SDUM812002]